MLYPISSTEIFELLAYNLCFIVRYQSVGYAKTRYYAMQKFDCVLLSDTYDLFCLNPLSKGVYGNDQEPVSSLGFWEWSKYINTPSGEWPR